MGNIWDKLELRPRASRLQKGWFFSRKKIGEISW
jgi:hypothetical protein